MKLFDFINKQAEAPSAKIRQIGKNLVPEAKKPVTEAKKPVRDTRKVEDENEGDADMTTQMREFAHKQLEKSNRSAHHRLKHYD
jgi:uncharacterized protein with gpF-like domain